MPKLSWIADLHIHSHYSRASSSLMHPRNLHRTCLYKGIQLIGTGDFTHPLYLQQLKDELEPAEKGFYRLKPELQKEAEKNIPFHLRQKIRFLLSAEVSCSFTKNGISRKIHMCILARTLRAAEKLNRELAKFGSLETDGRPLLQLDAKQLLQIVLQSDYLLTFPAHIWTPNFSLFGSKSGFNSLETCFENLSPSITALETGLSSDPEMNRNIIFLRNRNFLSFSDAHSPQSIAREATEFSSSFNWRGLKEAFVFGKGLQGTIEFPSIVGKYYYSGHRHCNYFLTPAETKPSDNICPHCIKPINLGVSSRIEGLSKQVKTCPQKKPDSTTLIPLKNILTEVKGIKTVTSSIDRLYQDLIHHFGSELFILRELNTQEISNQWPPLLQVAIERMRRGGFSSIAGYDGQYGQFSLLHTLDDNGGKDVPGQLALL